MSMILNDDPMQPQIHFHDDVWRYFNPISGSIHRWQRSFTRLLLTAVNPETKSPLLTMLHNKGIVTHGPGHSSGSQCTKSLLPIHTRTPISWAGKFLQDKPWLMDKILRFSCDRWGAQPSLYLASGWTHPDNLQDHISDLTNCANVKWSIYTRRWRSN